MKINCDAEVSIKEGKGAVGVVARDSDGGLKAGRGRQTHVGGVLVAEAEALRDGPQSALEMRRSNVTYEADPKLLILELGTAPEQASWQLQPLLTDIRLTLEKVENVKIDKISRTTKVE